MKITNRQIDSNKEQISRQITETWTTADGKQRIVTVNAETTGAEEWTTQTTAWRVYIMNKKNPNDTFLHKTTHNGGCQGEMNLLPVLEETRLARTEARENRNPDEPVQADDATRDTKLRDLIDKDDYQYEEIPADMTV